MELWCFWSLLWGWRIPLISPRNTVDFANRPPPHLLALQKDSGHCGSGTYTYVGYTPDKLVPVVQSLSEAGRRGPSTL